MFGIITRMKEQETRCTVHFSFRKSQSEHFALMMMMTYDDDHCIRQQWIKYILILVVFEVLNTRKMYLNYKIKYFGTKVLKILITNYFKY